MTADDQNDSLCAIAYQSRLSHESSSSFLAFICNYCSSVITTTIIIINIFLLSWEQSYDVFLDFHQLKNFNIN